VSESIICFSQPPNGFFPIPLFVGKLSKARELKKQMGGKIVWFCHDSDNSYKATETQLIDKHSGVETSFNFSQENDIQKKFSPLYAKRIVRGWQEQLAEKLPNFIEINLIRLFLDVKSDTAAGFCIRMYQKMGLLEGVEIVRSSDPSVRRGATEVADFFVDTEYENETVSARFMGDSLKLVSLFEKDILLPLPPFNKEKISPSSDIFTWIQSVMNCSHYIYGSEEKDYITPKDYPGVSFIEEVPNKSKLNYLNL